MSLSSKQREKDCPISTPTLPDTNSHYRRDGSRPSSAYGTACSPNTARLCRLQHHLRSLPSTALRAATTNLRIDWRRRSSHSDICFDQSGHLWTCRVSRPVPYLLHRRRGEQELQPSGPSVEHSPYSLQLSLCPLGASQWPAHDKSRQRTRFQCGMVHETDL